MSDETIETVKTMLATLLEETEDSEVHYKLRTALQLLEIHEDELDRLSEVAEQDSEVEERLRNLGYLD